MAGLKAGNNHGGRRPGAGCKRGSKNTSWDIVAACRALAPDMIKVLESIARDVNAATPARTAAANSIVDRGYGRAPQTIEHSGTTLQRVTLELSAEDRALLAEAREGLRDPAPTPTLAGSAQPNGAAANGSTKH